MFKKLKDEYVSNKYYSGMYIHMAGNEALNSIINIFVGPFLYSTGVSLSTLFLFYFIIEATFLIGLVFTPFLINKFGYKKIFFLSFLFSFSFFLLIVFFDHSILWLLLSAIFYGLKKSFYYPISDGLQASFIKTINRGKQISLQSVIVSLFSVFAVFIAGLILKSNLFLLIIFVLLFMIFSLFPFFTIFKKAKFNTKVKSYKEVLFFLFSGVFKKRFIQTFGFSVSHKTLTTLLALYAFLLLNNFKLFSAVIIISILFETIAKIYFGRIIDNKGQKSALKFSTAIVYLGNLLLLFFNQSVLIVSLLKVYINGSFNLLINSYDVNYNDRAKKSNQVFLFSLSVLLVMALNGILFYGILAILSYFLPTNLLFFLFFSLSLAGLLTNLKYFRT